MPQQSQAPLSDARPEDSFRVEAPRLSLPTGGGAIRGIGETYSANPATGTGSLSVPIFASDGRSGFGPKLSVSYDSGSGNGPFGLGWSLSLPSVTRKTDKGLPRYEDAQRSDVFILSGAEDLVPALEFNAGQWDWDSVERTVFTKTYRIERFRPRVEGLFARIERWTNLSDAQDVFWRSIARDNVTTWYGKTTESRIYDPADHARVFSWLICESYDDKGNACIYRYKPEDSAGVDLAQAHERNRSADARAANRYLKRALWGNRTPYAPDLTAAKAAAVPDDWCFELVLDFGEHDLATPTTQDTGAAWTCRADPFSTFRSGFDIRTYRRCRRALMFHHFPADPAVGAECLVRSTDFAYAAPGADPAVPFYSVLLSTRQTGYRRSGASYLARSLPPLEFAYSAAVVDETVRELDADTAQGWPHADSAAYQWVDLDGEGSPGMLSEQAGAWFFKRNLSPANQASDEAGVTATRAQFAAAELVMSRPSLAALAGGRQQLLDLAGDGDQDLVQYVGDAPGFFERRAHGWRDFTPFRSLPLADFNSPKLRFVDLSGDGLADVLITEGEVLRWYPSLGREGFGTGQRVAQASDEEQAPRVVFGDGTETIFLADLSGDGLSDLVRVRSGEVCYWPNLGYGRFGAKVTMDGAPWFDRPDLFDARRLRLADIDGSGTADIVYFARGEVHLYFNQSGNAWGARRTLARFPQVEHLSSASVLDLLGSGTACLVWSSPLPASARRPVRYVDLMGGQKPHLLIRIVNNLGAETRIQYAPSTKFYVADLIDGTPWLTRLPFPVHVVERVVTYDYVSRSRFVTRYAYHHGYYDGIEREFRGFGRVEQWDTEELATLANSTAFPGSVNEDAASHVPPTCTRTWFHTGAYFGAGRISKHLEAEYYGEDGLTGVQRHAMLLDDTELPDSILRRDGSRLAHDFTTEELREACRALRGQILRQEIYAADSSEAAARPYSVAERNYTLEAFQPRGANRYGVFFSQSRETVDMAYERKLYAVTGGTLADPNAPPPGTTQACDPRVTHVLTLRVDGYGNVLEAASLAYGRRYLDPALTAEDQAKQSSLQATLTESAYTNDVFLDDAHRMPMAAETRTYELLQVQPDANAPHVTNLFRLDEMRDKAAAAGDGHHDIAYEDRAPTLVAGESYRRLLAQTRTLYRPDDMGAAAGDAKALLPLRTMEPLALPGERYKLAFTPGLLSSVYQRGGAPLPLTGVLASTAADGGGYVDLDGDGRFWMPSGRVYCLPAPDTPANEKAAAAQHFFLPRRYQDTFGHAASVDFDADDLLAAGTLDAAGNATAAQNDYRVLKPALVTDPNGNQAAVAFDALGLVAGHAVMGKEGEGLGDLLTGFDADLTQSQFDDFYDAADPHTLAAPLLGNCTARTVSDVNRFYTTRSAAPDDPSQWQPAYAATIARETHVSDLAAGAQSRLQISLSYSDGFGREIQKKVQAEPGPVVDGGATVDPRWVGSAWTVFNNKGKTVRRYEPFFSQAATGHQFEFGVTVGVSPILLYDPAGRAIATVLPDHSYTKTVFDPWHQEVWDGNDTVLIDPAADPDLGDWFTRLPAADYAPSWYAQRSAGGGLDAQEQDAAVKTAAHAATPGLSYFDPLGRAIVTVADNGAAGKFVTRHDLDIQGNALALRDPLGRVVVRYDYSVTGRQIRQASMDAGVRWMLEDASGKAIRVFDDRGHDFRSTCDALRRPLGSFVRGSGPLADPRTLPAEVQYEKTVYGEGQATDQALNLRGRVFARFDCAGVTRSVGHNAATGKDEAYDFKGNPLRGSQQFVADVEALPDWSGSPALGPDIFASSATFDALNRALTRTRPDGSVMHFNFNEAGLLERLGADLRGAATTWFVDNLDYDAKGRRVLAALGNGASTTYRYDPLTSQLRGLVTTRQGAPADQAVVQDLGFTYDPSGNVTHVKDDADIHGTIFFRNRRVEPSADFTYDPIFRLTRASGREHLATAGALPPASSATSYNDAARTRLLHPGDGNAMGTYTEQYSYDAAGNITQLTHRGSDASNPGWTRTYTYGEASMLEPARTGNHLTRTTVGNGTPFNEDYAHDAHGNMIAMPQLQTMVWDFHDRLVATTRQAVSAADDDGTAHQGERTFYVYDATGERVRKATLRPDGTLRNQRFYLGDCELYREYDGAGTVTLERETLHVMDDKSRVAIVETTTIDASVPAASLPATATRYQFASHLGSALLELDATGAVISYEEYYPFGSTSYQAGRTLAEVSLKRYRYTGKECDEETGLQYNRARYYARWLGRWTAADPTGVADGTNLYSYVNNNPIRLTDPAGTNGDNPLNPNQPAQQPSDTTTTTVTDQSGRVVSTQTSTNAVTTDPPAAAQSGTPSPIFLSNTLGQPWKGVPYQYLLHEYTIGLGASGGLPASVSGGFTWLGSFRYGFLGPRPGDNSPDNQSRLSLDLGPVVGILGSGSFLSTAPLGGGSAGGSTSSGGFIGANLHVGIPLPSLGDDYGLGLYASPQVNLSGGTATAGASGTISLGQEPNEGGSWDANIYGSYVTAGSLSFPGSPTLSNLWTLGALYTSGGGDQSNEVYANYFRGTFPAVTPGGTDGVAQGLRAGYGHGWQWNWGQGPGQTNGFGLYVGGALEIGRIDPPSVAGMSSPGGLTAATISGIVNITLGANRAPPRPNQEER
jgi:RHS repeat-associated protein